EEITQIKTSSSDETVVPEETVELLGKSDLYFFSPEHPPLTEPAQKALDWAVDEKLKSGIMISAFQFHPTWVEVG
ncbi:hypothetical protein HN51_055482, partial [Arachis hypogaea]